jgi:RNA recognition motif-containing protein
VFVGNLSYATAWQDLKDHMKTVGEVAYCDIIPDGENKSLSSGSALVEYASAKQAARAIRELNDTELDGWTIMVREDRVGLPIGMVTNGGSVDRASVFGPGARGGGRGRGRGGGRGRGAGGRGGGTKVVIRTQGNTGGGGGGGGPSQRQIFVGNLPHETSWQNLKDVFKTMGEVERVDMQGRGGSGTVLMATAKQARAAITQFDRADFDGRIITVKLDAKA